MPNTCRSPALTISKVVLSLRSMLASNTDKQRPEGDQMYWYACGTPSSVQGCSPVSWQFKDVPPVLTQGVLAAA